jgi:hypothetical protein
MRKPLLSIMSALVLATLFVMPASAKRPDFAGLRPGQQVVYKQTIPVNLVFIGYNNLDKGDLLGQLPASYEPVVRAPQFYGLPGRDMGLRFNFKYKVVRAGKSFDDRFFRHLAAAGQPGPLTLFQQQYNDQDHNLLDVTGPVLYIDAPSVEQWLAKRGRDDLGIDQRSYTIYFINWYSRPDFQFHVYTKTDEPDPDTGYNFGVLRASRKIIAWGGTDTRTWFFDPSAGPEAKGYSWNVDDADVDGDDEADYRIPPIWEYAKGGYRKPAKLSGDLGMLARYVGIDLLFTTSPLYDPLNTTPGPGGAKVVHIEVLQADPNSDGRDYVRADFIRRKMRSLEPYYDWKVRVEQTRPIDAGAEEAVRIWAGLSAADDCWNDIGTIDAELFCYFDTHLSQYVPSYGPNDYVGEVFAFNTQDDIGDLAPLGFADDNWTDGTQSYVFGFDSPGVRALGYGLTTTVVHEFGHHIGLSHPHDGYDSEQNLDFGPSGDLLFAWSGDETNTMMSYIDLNWDFGQFDRDNMYRWEMAGYLNKANQLLGEVLAHPKAARVEDRLERADRLAQQAQQAFDRWDYLEAASDAYHAYQIVAAAAAELGIATRSAAPAIKLGPNPNVPHQVDPIHGPEN